MLKKEVPYVPIKYFISSLNTFFAHHLVQRLRNDTLHPENPNRIVGTAIANSKFKVPQGVRKVIDVEFSRFRSKRSPFSKKCSSTLMSSSTTSTSATSKRQSLSSPLSRCTHLLNKKHSSASPMSWLGPILQQRSKRKARNNKEKKIHLNSQILKKKAPPNRLKGKKKRYLIVSATKITPSENQHWNMRRLNLSKPYASQPEMWNKISKPTLSAQGFYTGRGKAFWNTTSCKHAFKIHRNCLSLVKAVIGYRQCMWQT